jgi:hypothetical protein
MQITINFDKNAIIETLEKLTRTSVRFFYKWLTSEGEALGYILGSIHVMAGIFIFLLIIISHTVYPNFYFQAFAFVLLLAVWIQHIFLKVCIIIVAEKRLNKQCFTISRYIDRYIWNYSRNIWKLFNYS